MIIDGFNKLTLLDYPGTIACILFTRGCNFNCSYCQNSTLISNSLDEGLINEEEIFTYLNKRINVLEGVVISGGEPTIQKDLIPFIKKVKEMGFKVKLDTNGTNPRVIQELLDNKLVDYIAMDIKHDLDNYSEITKCIVNTNLIKKSVEILKKAKVEVEFRTTVIKEFHTIEGLINIAKMTNGQKFYIQNFVDSENVRDKLHGFSKEELELMCNTLKKYNADVALR